MGITVGSKVHFNGKTGAQITDVRAGADPYVVNDNWNAAYYHCRVAITTDAYGASRVTVSGLSRIRANGRRLRLDVTGSSASHTKSGGGGVALAADGTGGIDVKLSPNTGYYVWLFCDGWCDLFNDTGLALSASGSYGTAGSPAVSDGSFGANIPVAVTGGSAGARYTVTVSCAGQTTVLQTQSANTSLVWNPELSVYAPLIPDSGSAPAVFTVQTYYSGVLIGTQTRTVTVSFAPGALPPALSPGWASAAWDNSGGAAAGIAAWVQGYSRARVSFDAAKVACQYGASVAGYKIVCQGTSDTASPYLTDVLTGTAASIVCTVYDSRGQSASETLTVTLEAYAEPALTGVRLWRSGADGTEDEGGGCIAVQATALVSPLGGENLSVLRAYVRPVGGSWDGGTALLSGALGLLRDLSPDRSYDVKLELTDSLGHAARYEQRLPSRAWAMKFRPDGRGVGFGRAPEQGAALELPADWALVFGAKRLGPALLGATEEGTAAAENHPAGDFFLWRGALVRAGAAIAAGDALAGAVAETDLPGALGRLTVERRWQDNLSVAASNVVSVTLDVSRSDGRRPLGILGHKIENAGSSGSGSSFCAAYWLYPDGTDVRAQIRNYSASAARIKLNVWVLYE